MRRFLTVLAAIVMLAGCSPATILNATAPRIGVTRITGISYEPGSAGHLDVYRPSAVCTGAPVVVFFYGGGWEDGNRAMYRFVGAALAIRGIVTVIPDYRLYPQVRFPAFMDDAAAAVAWTQENVTRYGGDPRHLFLMGHSAGGQIATLLALDTHYLKTAGVDPSVIAGVIGLSGPYDFLPLTDPTLQKIFGPKDTWPSSQPINFVTRTAPPMLLATGTSDTTVYPRNTEHLAAKLRSAGVSVEERHYPHLGHELMIGAFATPLSLLAPTRRDTIDFITAHHPICATTSARVP
ncbi:alpha/beta hydrolase [Acidisphaera sp. S103]|uniref:alpha/beta hydrolase n=1 Tax=Acidisphaera sp. S103 TaxID=1747223 RepID=UPI00131D2C53|nr:alpha/beta hydrolase [Acidisphaera sp. S103]